MKNVQTGFNIAMTGHVRAVTVGAASHGMHCMSRLLEHWHQLQMTGTAELRSVILAHQITFLPPPLELACDRLHWAGKPSSTSKGGIPIGHDGGSLSPLKSSTAKDPFASVVHHLLLPAVHCEPELTNPAFSVQIQNPAQDGKKLSHVR